MLGKLFWYCILFMYVSSIDGFVLLSSGVCISVRICLPPSNDKAKKVECAAVQW